MAVILESGFDGRVYICSSKRGTYGVSILRRRREGEFKNAVVFVLFESREVLTGESLLYPVFPCYDLLVAI